MNEYMNTIRIKRVFYFGIPSILGITIYLLFLTLTNPGEIGITKSAEPIGINNSIRAWTQGEKFWADQLREIERELNWQRRLPEGRKIQQAMIAQLDKEQARRQQEAQALADQLFPQTEEEKRARELRAEAERLEDASRERTMEIFRQKRIEELSMLSTLILHKHLSHISRQPY